MKLSIVDLGTVAPDSTETDALADALETARHAEQHGFHRIWFAEHHLTTSGASHHPELLIAAAAAVTSRIRVGQQVLETLAWLYETFPEDHPFHGHQLAPSVPQKPQTWLLGSSPNGSNLAAGLGIGYTFAGFINPPAAAMALRQYRSAFQPRDFGLETPRAILAVNVTVGETTAEGRYLAGMPKGYYARLTRAGSEAGKVMVPSADVADRELSQAQKDEPTTIVEGRWPKFVAGGPQDVRATLEQMLEESQADELMIQDLIADPTVRRRSHELLAEAFGLPVRQ